MTRYGSVLTLLLLVAVFHPGISVVRGQGAVKTPPATAIVPNGRAIHPLGDWIQTAPYPFALTVKPGGGEVVVPSIGWPFSLNVITMPADASSVDAGQRGLTLVQTHRMAISPAPAPARVRRLPPGSKNDPEVEVQTGVAYSRDGSLLFDSTGDSGFVDLYNTADWTRVGRIALDGVSGLNTFRESFAAALCLSLDGRRLYVVDQGNWRVVVIDTVTRKKVGSVPTGANPFGIALSPDGMKLYVTNSGLFEYRPIEGVQAKDGKGDGLPAKGLKFPPTGYPSRETREGLMVEGHAVAGLGSENDVRGSSLWTYDVGDDGEPHVLAKLRLGARIGGSSEEAARSAIGGAAPMGVVAGKDKVYVALAHEDAVAVVSAGGGTLLREIALTPFTGRQFLDRQGRPLRGIMPAGLALHGDRLCVAEAGINAVAVVDTVADQVVGHLSVGWFPTALAFSADGSQLFVVNTKGRGTGPNAGKGYDATRSGSYIGELEFGSLSVLPVTYFAAGNRMQEASRQVLANNLTAVGAPESLPRLKHVFLVIRENRTFDEILGDLPGGNGDSTLSRWGMHGWLADRPAEKDLQVTPNAHALAARFATSDQFFVDSDVSADGHRWLVAAAETPWFHVAWTSNYGGRRREDSFSAAPGRRALGGGNDGPMPEDEPEFGTLWEHVSNAGLPIRNYGEGLELAGSQEVDGSAPQGQRLVLNSPVPAPVFTSTDRDFATFNLGIPDQVRADEFLKDFTRVLGGPSVPSLIVIRLPGDHTADPRPADGYWDRASYVADNDLALGRIVDLISHASIWADSAILVTEDDAQGGVDHVDAHRSVMLAISPYIRPGTISHRHSSMGSLQKTAYELLGIGPLNLEDALAGDLGDVFMATPDLAPFQAVPVDKRVFDPARARVAQPKSAKEARALLDCDDPDDIRRQFRPVGRQKRRVPRKDADD